MTDLKEMSDSGLQSLHEGVIRALTIDDETTGEKPFNVRGTGDWRKWSDLLEAEMTRRRVKFNEVPW